MSISGSSLIGGEKVEGEPNAFHAVNPTTDQQLEPAFGEAQAQDIAAACALAAAAFDSYRETDLETRAVFLETIAAEIEAVGDALLQRAAAETGLAVARIETERARTTGQLRLFAATVRQGGWLDARIDPALPDRQPLPRPDLRLRNIGIGPVAVFGSSNFPLAFSVAGGDTAAALAAGCPVVVKAHPAHPGTSALVGKAVEAAILKCKMPPGVFSLLFGAGTELGTALVSNPEIKAVGFTGSRNGGIALMKIAAARPEPIPVHAEMSSINPVILLPAALAARSAAIAKGFVGSLTMGAGQFCTNPGLLIAQDGPDLNKFMAAVSDALAAVPAATMLTPGIFKAYQHGTEALLDNENVAQAAHGKAGDGPNQGEASFFIADAAKFLIDDSMRNEVFGASSLLIKCRDQDEMLQVIGKLEGQLTFTLQLDEADLAAARSLLPVLERKAGRILANGWPTGVEVSHAMVHGGPFPATSDPRTTSVGTLAIRRFLRPICYQDIPLALLPDSLQTDNKAEIPRLVDGVLKLA
jgi:alpha-ketoglutaric semialdehyde dehydrogenase